MSEPAAAPTSQQEYEQRFKENMRIEGYGFEVTMHSPCPFCAEPDCMVYRVIETQEVMAKEHTCVACGRTTKTLFQNQPDGGVQFEVVQTAGDDPPAWMTYPPRRV